MSPNTVRNFMRVADVYGAKSANVAHLDASALYELAAPSTPPEIRVRVEETLVDGEKVTVVITDGIRRGNPNVTRFPPEIRGRALKTAVIKKIIAAFASSNPPLFFWRKRAVPDIVAISLMASVS